MNAPSNIDHTCSRKNAEKLTALAKARRLPHNSRCRRGNMRDPDSAG
jgi:hypothetical protein